MHIGSTRGHIGMIMLVLVVVVVVTEVGGGPCKVSIKIGFGLC